MVIFTPKSTFVKVAPYLCICERCLVQVGSCELYRWHELISNTMKGFSFRSEECNLDKQNHNDESYSNMDFIAEDSICAMLARIHLNPFGFF